MEYCHCGSIAAYLRKGNRLSEEELREVVSCCLLGLSYLHAKKIIHRVWARDVVLTCRTSNRITCSYQRVVS